MRKEMRLRTFPPCRAFVSGVGGNDRWRLGGRGEKPRRRPAEGRLGRGPDPRAVQLVAPTGSTDDLERGGQADQSVDDAAQYIGLAELKPDNGCDEVELRECDQPPVQRADDHERLREAIDSLQLQHLLPCQSLSKVCPGR